MRAASSIVSLTTHVMLVVAALWATAGAHPRSPEVPIVMLDGLAAPESDAPVLGAPVITGGVTIPRIPLPNVEGGVVEAPHVQLKFGTDSGPVFAGTPPRDGAPIDGSLADEPPQMLAGPSAAYPDLLRRAGIHGRVVLEAVIDTLGHVEPGSVAVVESAHPAFVAPAQRSLVASLFRPARVMGRAVRVRVRLAFDFVLRDGRL